MLCMSIFKLAVGCFVLLFGKHFLSITSSYFTQRTFEVCQVTPNVSNRQVHHSTLKKIFAKVSCKCEVFVQSLILFSNMAFKRILLDMFFDSLYHAFTQLPFIIFDGWMHGQFDAFSGHMKVVNTPTSISRRYAHAPWDAIWDLSSEMIPD